jgi:hypothetical protein
VRDGWNTSSRRYRSLIDGNPINIRMKAGTTVQNSSSGWDSVIFLSRVELKIIEFILNPTIETIRRIIVIVWS